MANVLVVEDNTDLAAVLVQLLQMSGFTASSVGNGAAALSKIRTSPPDLMLLDVMMPGLSGLDVLREMKLDPALANLNLRVVMFTALDDPETRREAMGLGASDYLIKGRLDAAALENMVRKYL